MENRTPDETSSGKASGAREASAVHVSDSEQLEIGNDRECDSVAKFDSRQLEAQEMQIGQLNVGFSTAAGRAVPVSDEAVARVSRLFGDETNAQVSNS